MLLLLITGVASATNFEEHQMAALTYYCDSLYKAEGPSEVYYCILSEVYAFQRVYRWYNEFDNFEYMVEQGVLENLLKKHFINKYKTHAYVVVKKEFEDYLEKEATKREGEGK